LCDPSRNLDTRFERDDGENVHDTEARMDAVMNTHVELLDGAVEHFRAGTCKVVRFVPVGDDAPVVVGVGVDVEERTVSGDQPNQLEVTSLGDVGNSEQ
jgi:hypothetical protein